MGSVGRGGKGWEVGSKWVIDHHWQGYGKSQLAFDYYKKILLLMWAMTKFQTCHPLLPMPHLQSSPGPGEYAGDGGGTGSDGPAFTLRGRVKEPVPPLSPGPGDYHQGREERGPAFTMAGRCRDEGGGSVRQGQRGEVGGPTGRARQAGRGRQAGRATIRSTLPGKRPPTRP